MAKNAASQPKERTYMMMLAVSVVYFKVPGRVHERSRTARWNETVATPKNGLHQYDRTPMSNAVNPTNTREKTNDSP